MGDQHFFWGAGIIPFSFVLAQASWPNHTNVMHKIAMIIKSKKRTFGFI